MADVQVRGFTIGFKGIVHELITECGVSLPYNPAMGGAQPLVIKTKGLWDTGASNSVITKELAARLGLTAIRTVESHHAGGQSTVNVYLINIYLPNQTGVSFVQVSECIETIGRFGLLIGMDIISAGDFALSGSGGMTTMSFRLPASWPIHLEKDCLPPSATKSQKIGQQPNVDLNTSRNTKCPCGSGKLYKRCHGQNK